MVRSEGLSVLHHRGASPRAEHHAWPAFLSRSRVVELEKGPIRDSNDRSSAGTSRGFDSRASMKVPRAGDRRRSRCWLPAVPRRQRRWHDGRHDVHVHRPALRHGASPRRRGLRRGRQPLNHRDRPGRYPQLRVVDVPSPSAWWLGEDARPSATASTAALKPGLSSAPTHRQIKGGEEWKFPHAGQGGVTWETATVHGRCERARIRP